MHRSGSSTPPARALAALGLAVLLGACGSDRVAAPAAPPAPVARITPERLDGRQIVIGQPLRAMRLDSTPGAGLARGIRGALTAAAANNYFVQWIRYNAEMEYWGPASDSVFYRDVYAGAETYASAAEDGDSWYVTAQLPNGTTVTWSAIRFYATYNGQQDCFVASGLGGWVLCGARSAWIDWYRYIQCAEPGMWHFTFYYNAQPFDTRDLKVVSQVDERLVPLLAQGDPEWGADLYDHSCTAWITRADGTRRRVGVPCDDTASAHHTIHQRGCAITSASMVLGYHGATTTPRAVNTWLRDNDGYGLGGMTKFTHVARFGRSMEPQIAYDQTYFDTTSATRLRELICKFGPQVIGVRNLGHFVAAFGWDPARRTFLIHDPAGGVSRTLEYYGNVFNGIRLITGKEKTVTDRSGIRIAFHSPVEIVVTDPLGRRIGYDPRLGVRYGEVPAAGYGAVLLDDDETGGLAADEDVKALEIGQPVAGTYTVSVMGTDAGTYTAEFETLDVGGEGGTAVIDAVPVTAGAVHTYQFAYDPTAPAAAPALGGAFQGGGQRDDVDDMLTYALPSTRQTTLPTGATTFEVMITYGPTIQPATFGATLDGSDVTAAFHPAPGRTERVMLPAGGSRTVLKLRVSGAVGSRTATDSDQLVFVR